MEKPILSEKLKELINGRWEENIVNYIEKALNDEPLTQKEVYHIALVLTDFIDSLNKLNLGFFAKVIDDKKLEINNNKFIFFGEMYIELNYLDMYLKNKIGE